MSFKSTLKRLRKAVPIIAANAPALIELFTELRQAVKKPKKKAAEAAE